MEKNSLHEVQTMEMEAIPRYEISEDFDKYGVVVIREVLSQSEVHELRQILDKIFLEEKDPLPRMILSYDIFKVKELYLIPFKEKIVEKLKSTLGEKLCYFSDFQVQRNMFGIPGWHRDCGNEAGNDYLCHPSYKFVKCGVFLQDYNLG